MAAEAEAEAKAEEAPATLRYTSRVYVWTDSDGTGIRYGVHIPQHNAPVMDTTMLRNFAITAVQSLQTVSRPFVLVHFLPGTQRIELSLPDLGSEDEVREIAREAEKGPQRFLALLLREFEQNVREGAVKVEYLELRFNELEDLKDATRYIIVHNAQASLSLNDSNGTSGTTNSNIQGLVDFFILLQNAGIKALPSPCPPTPIGQ